MKRPKNEELIEIIAQQKAQIEGFNERIKLLTHNSPLLEIREEVSELIDISPAKIQVIRVRQKVYASKSSNVNDINFAPQMPMPIPKSKASVWSTRLNCQAQILPCTSSCPARIHF